MPADGHISAWTAPIPHREFEAPVDITPAVGMVSLVWPPDGSTAVTPTNLVLRASTKLPDVIRMEFYDGDTMVGVAENAPWQVVYRDVPSGVRTLRAYAVDKAFNGEYSAPASVSVQWTTPLNDYQTSATDLSVAATGLSPSLARSYDSGSVNESGAAQGALGRGWQASWTVARLRVGNDGDLGSGWGPGSLNFGVRSIAESVPHPITITLLDGQEVQFWARLKVGPGANTLASGDPLLSPITSLFYDAVDKDSGSLTGGQIDGLGLGSSNANYSGGDDWSNAGDLTLYLGGSPLVDGDAVRYFHPAEFTYVSVGGTTYVFEAPVDTGDHWTWRLRSVTDGNGHSLKYIYESAAPFRLTKIDHDGVTSDRDICFDYVSDGSTETISAYDPIEWAKSTDRRATVKYIVGLSGSERLHLKEVHRLTQRRNATIGLNERYEVVRYAHGTAAHDLNRIVKVEAGLKRYGPFPGVDEVLDSSVMPWLQVLGNTYEGANPADSARYGRLKTQVDARGSSSTIGLSGTSGLTPEMAVVSTVNGTVGGATVTETVKYNASGQITEVTPSGGGASRFLYNEKGLLASEIDPAGNVKIYHYDRQDRLVGTTDGGGNGGRTTFNRDGSVFSTVDAVGNEAAFSYDARGNLERSVDSLGVVTSRVYFSAPGEERWFGLVRREVVQVPNLEFPIVRDFEYTAAGDLSREIRYIDQGPAPALGASRSGFNCAETEYTYDGNGNRLTEKVWRTVIGIRVSSTTTTIYDGQGRAIASRDPLYTGTPATLRESFTTYDTLGRVLKTRDLYGNVTEMFYDPTGNLIQTVYPDGTVTRTIFDERNRIRFTQDRIVPVDLNACKAPSQTTLTTGPGTETLYDGAGRSVGTRRWGSFTVKKMAAVAPVVGAEQTVTALSNASGTVISSVTGSPYSTSRTVYDVAGRIKYSINVDGRVVGSQYNAAGQRSRELTYTVYQAPANDFTSTISPTGPSLVTTFGYDPNGNQLWVLDAKGQDLVGSSSVDSAEHQRRRTDFRYDAANRRILSYSPIVDGEAERKYRQTLYDGAGRQTVVFDEAGVATAFGYDNLGRLTSVTNDFRLEVPVGITLPVTRYAYDEAGNQTKQIDAMGRETKYEYDALGRRTKRVLPFVAAAPNTYHLDEVVSYSDVLSGGTYVEQRQVTAFNGRRLTFKHDKMGRLSEKTLEVPSSPAPPAVPAAWSTEATLSFTYTPQGWLKKVAEIRTGSSARYTFFGYDSYGRLTKKDSPEGVLAYAYLPNGSVDTLKGYPRSVVAQPVNPATATDALALPTSPTPVPDVSLKYEYDRLGRLQKVSDLDGTGLSFANDSCKTLYAYDANGNQESVRYPESGSLSVEHRYSYTAQNRLKQLDLQCVNRTTGLPSTRLLSFLYRLNASGQRIAVIEDDDPVNSGTPRAVQYVYDTDDADNTPSTTPDPQPRARLNRLSQELVTTYDESVPRLDEVDGTFPYFFHRYDLVGNRTYSKQVPTPTVPDSVVTLQPYYDNRDRLDSDSTPGNANAIYDANGNTLTLKSMTLGVSSYDESPNAAAGNVPAGDTYDAENRLVKRVVREVYDANNWRQTTLVLTYDHAGNRVQKVKTVENRLKDPPYTASGTTTTTTTYLVDEVNHTGYAQVLAEYQSVGAGSLLLNRAYAYGLDLISQRIGGSSTRDYYGYDGHGSVRRLLTVSGGRVLSGPGTQPDYTYDAYGRLLASTDTTTTTRNVYRFAGEQWDLDLGLSYNRARYLNSGTGRFWSMDSNEGSQGEPSSLHKYLYVSANPINVLDPSGYQGDAISTSGAIGGSGSLAGNIAAGVARASLAAYRGLAWAQANPVWTELALSIGVPGGIYAGVELSAAAAEGIANLSQSVNDTFSQNTFQFSPGPVVRGVESEERLLRVAIQRAGGQFYGGTVSGIDGLLACDDNGILIQGKTRDVATARLLPTILNDMETMSGVTQKKLSGRTSPSVGGYAVLREPGPSAANALVVGVPENQARYIISPQFISALRSGAERTRVVPIVQVIRNWPGRKR